MEVWKIVLTLFVACHAHDQYSVPAKSQSQFTIMKKFQGIYMLFLGFT